MKKGYVIQLQRGIYTTRRFYEFHRGDASFVPAVSAILNPQSYISLEYVLQQSSVLTDITYPTTAITIKNTKKIENGVGTFVYRHIRQPLYLGFIPTEYFGVIINQASVPKALFDFFYLRPLPRKLRTTRIDLAEDLRLNVADFSSEERSEFTEYVKISKSAKMDFILDNFRRKVATLIQLLQNTLATKDPTLGNETKRVLLKEVLQTLVLDFIYNHPVYRDLNFYEGTCLHVIYELNRLSEDIDLDNSQEINLDNFSDDLLDYITKRLGYRDATGKRQESKQGIVRVTLRFPVLFELGLSPHRGEMLHLKVEVSQHMQIAEIKQTPVIKYGRSFVPSHFSLETMMAGKILTCLERSFQVGDTPTTIKGRDFYDLLWFMQKRVQPLEEKLEKDGVHPFTTKSSMLTLEEKIAKISSRDLSIDLLPLFEQRAFIEAWIASFHSTFEEFVQYYIT
jgi:predicted nucleotidyltransferase component of viral defense system